MTKFIKSMEELKNEFLDGKMEVNGMNMSMKLSERVCCLSGDIVCDFEDIEPPEVIYADEPCKYEYFISHDGTDLNLYYDDEAKDITDHLTILYEKHLTYAYDKDSGCFVRPEIYGANPDIILIRIYNPSGNWDNEETSMTENR